MINGGVLPEISVIVCSHNHDKWIERCVRSLAHQEDIAPHDYEILVVNDASTDNTRAVLQNMAFLPNLRIIENEQNLGLPASINKALKSALGRYVVRVDSESKTGAYAFEALRREIGYDVEAVA